MSEQFDLETIEVSMLPELQGWKEKQETIVKENPFVQIVDNKTYEEAKKVRTALVSARTTIEKQDKLIASKLKDVRTKAGKFSEELINITLPHEEKQQEEVRRYEAVKEAERLEKERLDKVRKDAIQSKIETIYQSEKVKIDNLTFAGIENLQKYFNDYLYATDVVEFEEFELQFASKIQLIKQHLSEKISLLNEREAQKIEAERLAKEKADFEAKAKADAEKLAKEKAEFEAEKKAKDEADEKERMKREAEQKAIDDANAKRQAELDAKQKAIDDAEAKRQAEFEAEQKAKETPVENIEVITVSEEVAEPQTPVENINKFKTNTPTDSQIKEFLIGLAKEQYDHGDDFYAHKNKKGNWEFGSTNDEPLKFGNGHSNVLESKLAIIIFNKCNQ
jgi:colicin import membrane protein